MRNTCGVVSCGANLYVPSVVISVGVIQPKNILEYALKCPGVP